MYIDICVYIYIYMYMHLLNVVNSKRSELPLALPCSVWWVQKGRGRRKIKTLKKQNISVRAYVPSQVPTTIKIYNSLICRG